MLTEREQHLLKQQDEGMLRLLVQSLVEDVKKLRQENVRLKAEQAGKAQAVFALEERVKLLRRSLYADSAEKRSGVEDRPRESTQEEARLFAQAAFPAPDTAGGEKGKLKGRDLPTEIIDYQLTLQELQAQAEQIAVQGSWSDTGLYDESTKIQIIERRYVKEIHRKRKYKFKPDNPEDLEKELIITAPGPGELLPGMNYTTDFVASVVADKYISHVPLERQLREMESLGLNGMKNSTLSRLSALAAASLEPLAEDVLKRDLMSSRLAWYLDETPWKIQNKHEKDGFMWVISNYAGSYYFFAPTRSAELLAELIHDYRGPVLTDGHSSYDTHLDNQKNPHAYCWAHVRREFLPLEDHDPSVKPILDLIDELFRVEREARDFEHLQTLRESRSGPLIKELQQLLLDELSRSREQSQKRKGIEYALKRWVGLTLFVQDTRIPLSNNEAERTIRHAVMGRKNYYGSGSHTGAKTAATLFTIIESCKKNDLDPRTFVIDALHRVAAGQPLETPLTFAQRTRQLAN